MPEAENTAPRDERRRTNGRRGTDLITPGWLQADARLKGDLTRAVEDMGQRLERMEPMITEATTTIATHSTILSAYARAQVLEGVQDLRTWRRLVGKVFAGLWSVVALVAVGAVVHRLTTGHWIGQ